MTKRPRRNHSPAFKAKVAVASIIGAPDGLEIPSLIEAANICDEAVARAHLAIHGAEASIRSLTTAKEVRHEIEVLPEAERDRRLDRWMRD